MENNITYILINGFFTFIGLIWFYSSLGNISTSLYYYKTTNVIEYKKGHLAELEFNIFKSILVFIFFIIFFVKLINA